MTEPIWKTLGVSQAKARKAAQARKTYGVIPWQKDTRNYRREDVVRVFKSQGAAFRHAQKKGMVDIDMDTLS